MPHSNAAQQQAKTALLALAAPAKPLTKIEQFRTLLPDIEQRIRDGIRHGQIIEALAGAGLVMTESEFRNALCRERKRKKGQASEASQTPAAATPPKAATAASKPDTTARGDYRQQRGQPLKW